MYLFICLLTIVCLMLPTPGRTDQQSGAREAIQSIYNSINRSAEGKDVDGITAHLDPSIQLIDLNGQTTAANRTSLQGYLRQVFWIDTNINDTVQITNIELGSDGATVNMLEHISFTVTNPLTGQIGTVVADNTCRDFWVTGKDGWMEKRSRVLASSHTLTGPGTIHVSASPHYW